MQLCDVSRVRCTVLVFIGAQKHASVPSQSHVGSRVTDVALWNDHEQLNEELWDDQTGQRHKLHTHIGKSKWVGELLIGRDQDPHQCVVLTVKRVEVT
jgi:hypothetical protein